VFLQIVKERIEQEYAKAERDIEQYKTTKLAKINEAMAPLLKNVVSLIISRSLSADDHEALIHDAIQDASNQIPELHHSASPVTQATQA
jgi:F0F1-type ATP synthase membrane subunit b/b'